MIESQRDREIKNYTKSLELNPENTSATEQLAKLRAPVNTNANGDE